MRFGCGCGAADNEVLHWAAVLSFGGGPFFWRDGRSGTLVSRAGLLGIVPAMSEKKLFVSDWIRACCKRRFCLLTMAVR